MDEVVGEISLIRLLHCLVEMIDEHVVLNDLLRLVIHVMHLANDGSHLILAASDVLDNGLHVLCILILDLGDDVVEDFERSHIILGDDADRCQRLIRKLLSLVSKVAQLHLLKELENDLLVILTTVVPASNELRNVEEVEEMRLHHAF